VIICVFTFLNALEAQLIDETAAEKLTAFQPLVCLFLHTFIAAQNWQRPFQILGRR